MINDKLKYEAYLKSEKQNVNTIDMSEIEMKPQDNTQPEDEENLNEISNIKKNKEDEEANLELDKTKDEDELHEDKENTLENTIETATVEDVSDPDNLNPNIVVIDCKEILKSVEEFKEVQVDQAQCMSEEQIKIKVITS